jgi:hypothetical protein
MVATWLAGISATVSSSYEAVDGTGRIGELEGIVGQTEGFVLPRPAAGTLVRAQRGRESRGSRSPQTQPSR